MEWLRGLNVIISIQVFQHCWLLFATLWTETRADPHTLHTLQTPPLSVHIFHISQWGSWTPKQILERLARFVFTIPDRRRGRERGREGRNWLSLKVVVVEVRAGGWGVNIEIWLSEGAGDTPMWWQSIYNTDLHVVIPAPLSQDLFPLIM